MRSYSISRRDMLAASLSLATPARGAGESSVEPTKVISQTPESFCGWPTIIRRRNGELLVVYSGGRQGHVCPFGRVEMIRSRDDGEAWSWPEVLFDSAIDDRDAGIVETATGELLVTTFTSLAYEAELKRHPDWPQDRVARWQAVNRRATEAQRRALLGSWMIRSDAEGLQWQSPARIPLNSPHGPVLLKSGRLLYAGKRLWHPADDAVIYASDNHGRDWHPLATVPVRPGDRTQDYHELHAVEAANGRLIVHIRNHNAANDRETLQCESGDGGKTWTVPHPIGVWGLPSHLLRLHDGRLLMTYGYRREPRGNLARLSNDHGATWQEPITLSADGTGDLGYPSTVELGDGRLLTVWYEVRKPSTMAVLRMVRWRI